MPLSVDSLVKIFFNCKTRGVFSLFPFVMCSVRSLYSGSIDAAVLKSPKIGSSMLSVVVELILSWLDLILLSVIFRIVLMSLLNWSTSSVGSGSPTGERDNASAIAYFEPFCHYTLNWYVDCTEALYICSLMLFT